MCGLHPVSPAYRRFTIRPYTDERFDWVCMSYNSARGLIRSAWKKQDNGTLYTVEVPFDTEADFVLDYDASVTKINGADHMLLKKGVPVRLKKGVYQVYVEK